MFLSSILSLRFHISNFSRVSTIMKWVFRLLSIVR